MVFPSPPDFLDPPNNWNQQQQPYYQPNPSTNSFPRPDVGGPRITATSRPLVPGSMVERARVAKIPQPESNLKCPRCESTNTKFCYFNNYNLSQPRHFCKACRRYWTRGGALRNVPVGGGCRRNKRNKSSAAVKPERNTTVTAASSSVASASGTIASNFNQMHQFPLQDYSQPNLGLGFGGLEGIDGVNYQVSSGGGGVIESLRLHQPQQVQQFPNFLGGLASAQQLLHQSPQLVGLFPFVGGNGGGSFSGQIPLRANDLSRVEEDGRRLNISANDQLLGVQQRNERFLASRAAGGPDVGWNGGNNQLI